MPPPSLYFYPRPPRGGRRSFGCSLSYFLSFLSTPSARRATWKSISWPTAPRFLSTPSARRATNLVTGDILTQGYFYPRPPRGGRPAARVRVAGVHRISIHALREEGDGYEYNSDTKTPGFLSTPSARRATCKSGRTSHPQKNFYPRPPRGGRRWTVGTTATTTRFLSTPSARRATLIAIL